MPCIKAVLLQYSVAVLLVTAVDTVTASISHCDKQATVWNTNVNEQNLFMEGCI